MKVRKTGSLASQALGNHHRRSSDLFAASLVLRDLQRRGQAAMSRAFRPTPLSARLAFWTCDPKRHR